MGTIDISKAMQAIKNERCCECGKRAKGLVYRGQRVNYYCKKCLSEYKNHKHLEAVAS